MAALRQHHNKWKAKVRVPKGLVGKLGREFIYRTLESRDRRAALVEAAAWEAALRAKWAAAQGHDSPALASVRQVYERVRKEALEGAFEADLGPRSDDPILTGIDLELERLAAANEGREPGPAVRARVAALNDAAKERKGVPVKPRNEFEPTAKELAGDYLKWWKRQGGLKGGANTEQQKKATLNLFGDYWDGKPLRSVTQPAAVHFFDALQTLSPSWARSPALRELPWRDLLGRAGQHPVGLSDATMNRHAATLQAFWQWAEHRGYAEGRNPFTGRRRRLRQGVNVKGYQPWAADELARLLDPPPRRADLKEVILVGMFTGMRLDEIASMKGSQIREDDGVTFIQVEDAKTPAGNRQVPIHAAIGWLKGRAEEAKKGRIWQTFNPEGPGKKAGADAGREFSRFKQSRGFTSREKAFHSFRKNVTRIMERAGVPENEWAQVFGHEKGFTYGRYNPDGITIQRKAEIIGLIAYPGVPLPEVG